MASDNTSVKINRDLLLRVERITKSKSKRIRYKDKKQFVNVAVLDLLEKEEAKDK